MGLKMERPEMPARAPRKRNTSAGRSAELSASGHRRTRSDHAAEIAEDYVELIDDLIAETGEARAVDLARRLGVTQVTVTKTIERLKREDLVTSEPYRSIFLTSRGSKLAREVRERHKTVLEFLRALGVPAKDAELDAEGIEHHISPATLAAMRRHLRSKK
jgi:DtxR family transcriptional regulator, manganese transport regulator